MAYHPWLRKIESCLEIFLVASCKHPCNLFEIIPEESVSTAWEWLKWHCFAILVKVNWSIEHQALSSLSHFIQQSILFHVLAQQKSFKIGKIDCLSAGLWHKSTYFIISIRWKESLHSIWAQFKVTLKISILIPLLCLVEWKLGDFFVSKHSILPKHV